MQTRRLPEDEDFISNVSPSNDLSWLNEFQSNEYKPTIPNSKAEPSLNSDSDLESEDSSSETSGTSDLDLAVEDTPTSEPSTASSGSDNNSSVSEDHSRDDSSSDSEDDGKRK